MAHVEKYKAHSVGHMLAHYRRDESSLERDNIDRELTERNVTLGHVKGDDGESRIRKVDWKPNWETVSDRIDGVNAAAAAAGRRAVRKDAVVMADLVVTLPRDVRKGDELKFFAACYSYLGGVVGRENLMGGFVHRDEWRTKTVTENGEKRVVRLDEHVRDHMHAPFTPILDGRFNYKSMCPRSFYKKLHKGMSAHVAEILGYEVELELGDDKKAEKALSGVDKDKLDAARADMERRAAEITRDAEHRRAELVNEIAEKEGDLFEVCNAIEDKEMELNDLRSAIEGESDRLECLQQAGDRVAGRVEALESIAADVRGFECAPRSGKGEILDRIARACDGLAARVRERAAELAESVVRVTRFFTERRKPESMAMDSRSLRAAAKQAKIAARELDGSRGDVRRDYRRAR